MNKSIDKTQEALRVERALKLALEALESCSAGDYSTGHVIHPSFDVDAVNKAIEAIDALAEQPEQDQGQSCYCPECERLSKELAALKAQSKPWVGLTSKEREELDAEAWHFGPEAQYGMRVSEMTEAKLREKNEHREKNA